MNKEKTETDKTFDTVKFFRTVKEKIAKETEGMSFAEFKAYLNKRKIKHGNKKPTAQKVV
ncbi:MAG: hypothetical protein IPG79_14850 [Saprospiraceae bacterium]|nr:hypothetical protein [Saprospiraceae bacterium]MBK7525881.1 hypothetical protein [Saprospiraceae bacterium]MBK8855940.1 hypothetical protein [Saprospiraceae bacterium]